MDSTAFWTAPIPRASMPFAYRLLDRFLRPVGIPALIAYAPDPPFRVRLDFDQLQLSLNVAGWCDHDSAPPVPLPSSLPFPKVGVIGVAYFRGLLLSPSPVTFPVPRASSLGRRDLACVLWARSRRSGNGISRMPRRQGRRVPTFPESPRRITRTRASVHYTPQYSGLASHA
jgi:hypothetical protein